VKKVVEKAFGEACDSAMGDHRTHRIWLQQRLQGVFTQLQVRRGTCNGTTCRHCMTCALRARH
jgi:hypothetical protein